LVCDRGFEFELITGTLLRGLLENHGDCRSPWIAALCQHASILAASIVPSAVQRSAIAAFRAQKMALLLMMENRNSLIVDAPRLSESGQRCRRIRHHAFSCQNF
jgi:hypothetical protein